jgi:hypothetical protein
MKKDYLNLKILNYIGMFFYQLKEMTLDLAIKAAKSREVNPNNLECFWYGPWNCVLTRLFSTEFTISPQHSLLFTAEDQDGNDKDKYLIPDFVVVQYKEVNRKVTDRKYVIVENKRSNDKNLISEIDEAKKQLESQVEKVFLDKSYKTIFGIVSVGEKWMWYKFSRNESYKGHNPKTSWGNMTYIESSSDMEVEEVPINTVQESPLYETLCISDFSCIRDLVIKEYSHQR